MEFPNGKVTKGKLEHACLSSDEFSKKKSFKDAAEGPGGCNKRRHNLKRLRAKLIKNANFVI